MHATRPPSSFGLAEAPVMPEHVHLGEVECAWYGTVEACVEAAVEERLQSDLDGGA